MTLKEGERVKYRFTETEVKKLLKNLVIVIDTREQKNQWITKYLDKKKIRYKVQKVDEGDYGCYIESNDDTKPLGVLRNWYFTDNVVVERKNSVDELVGSIKDRDRFEDEFNRAIAKGIKIFMIVEDANGYENIINGNYRSQYLPQSFNASLETFISRYKLDVNFIDKKYTAYKIYNIMKYHVRDILVRKGFFPDYSQDEVLEDGGF